MKRIVDWFWEYRDKRPAEWNLQPASLSKIMRLTNQDESIHLARKSGLSKSCIAFWGPSQSGKSSFLSHYLDGETEEDLALSWSGKVRFSSSPSGDDPETTVFNPFNAGQDASGLVTRFFLPEDAAKINAQYPVEIILANRRQVIHSLAVGYRMECQESANRWTLDELRKRTHNVSVAPNREAFELLFDMCEVCENMARDFSVYSEFGKNATLRNQILNSSCADSLDDATNLMTYLLWDGESNISKVYSNIIELRDFFHKKRVSRFFATMKVAALLENIAVADPNAPAVCRRAIKDIRFEQKDSDVFFKVQGTGDASFKFSEGEFGLFQALIAEIRIPIKRVGRAAAAPLLTFLSKCDLLDFPGVTNRASGDALGSENLLDFSKPEDANQQTILSRVYKIGKTLSTVYAQAEQCAIDSFVIFVDLEKAGGISRPATLMNGIRAWQLPYSTGHHSALPVYVNCSLFGKIVGDVAAVVQGGGLSKYCEKMGVLDFARRDTTEFLFTTNKFKQVPDLNVRHYLEEDSQFRQFFLHGRGRESLEAFFTDKMGSDYVLERLCGDVSVRARVQKYDEMQVQIRTGILNELALVLPRSEDEEAVVRQEIVGRVRDRLENAYREDAEEAETRILKLVKSLFILHEHEIDLIPKRPHHESDEKLADYVRGVSRSWATKRKDEIESASDGFVTDEEAFPFLLAIASVDVNVFVEMLKHDFHDHDASVSRPFLGMALNNAFLYGTVERPPLSLCEAFRNRVQTLATSAVTVKGCRPRHLDGDRELSDLVEDIKNR